MKLTLATSGPTVWLQRLLLLGLALLLGLSAYSTWAGYTLVGKTFSGFSMEFSFITFPVDSQEWTGSQADFQYFEQIRQVDGQHFANTSDFRDYIQSLPPGTPVSYTLLRDGKSVEISVPTMVFSQTDYFKTFGINLLLTWLYAGLSLFILLRRDSIVRSKALLFLTMSSAAAYMVRAPYDYLHSILPLSLLAFSAFPLSLFLMGSHLIKIGSGGRFLNLLEKLNVGFGLGIGLSLAVLSIPLAPSPQTQPETLGLFISIYEGLIGYYLVNLLLFIGFVLWRSLRRGTDALKNWQARIILVGALFSFVPHFVMLAACWLFRAPWSLPSELVAANTSLFVLFVFYAVLHDEGLALESFVKKTVFYYALLYVFALAYTVLFRLFTILLESVEMASGRNTVPFIAGLAALLVVNSLNQRLQNLIPVLFNRQHKRLQALLDSFGQDSTSTLEPHKLLERGLVFLREAFDPRSHALYLSPHLLPGTHLWLARYYAENGEYPEQLALDSALTSPAELQQFKRRYGLQKQVLLPLHKSGTLMGLVILDKKNSGLGYFGEDIELLQKFAFYFVTGFYIACLSQKTLAAYEKSEAAKRMEVLGTLAGGVAHDFNNLLSTIVMSVGLLKYLSEDPQILERLQVIQQSAEKGAAITRALGDYASTLPPDQSVPIHDLLLALEARLKDALPETVSLQIVFPPDDSLILADLEQILRALLELARNAEIAMAGHGTLKFEVAKAGRLPSPHEAFEANDQEFLCIRITDSGEGIPESIQARIFDPFFSAWTGGKGIGLGLAITRQIVKNHNGLIEFNSREAEGTSFSVYLPLASHKQTPALPDLDAMPAAPRQQEQILLIDDESVLRELLAEALIQAGHAVIEAGNGMQGLSLFREHHTELSLVVCDLEMPGFNGYRFIAAAREMAPAQRIIVSTGHISPADEKAFRQQGISVLHKPYTADQLLNAIQHSRSIV